MPVVRAATPGFRFPHWQRRIGQAVEEKIETAHGHHVIVDYVGPHGTRRRVYDRLTHRLISETILD